MRKGQAHAQKRLFGQTFQQFFATDKGLRVFYTLSEAMKENGDKAQNKKPSGVKSDGHLFDLFRHSVQPLVFLMSESSPIVSVGGHSRWISEHQIPHDFIELSPRTPSRIIEKCAPLYEKGLSLRDIEERTGIPKTTIRETLTKSGFALRNPISGNAKMIDIKSTKRGGSTPFGYAYLDGKLLIDPKEQIALRKIQTFHEKGKSYQAIADELNNKKIPTRSGKPWIRSVVRSIIMKAKDK
jgi:hypothetical protein